MPVLRLDPHHERGAIDHAHDPERRVRDRVAPSFLLAFRQEVGRLFEQAERLGLGLAVLVEGRVSVPWRLCSAVGFGFLPRRDIVHPLGALRSHLGEAAPVSACIACSPVIFANASM